MNLVLVLLSYGIPISNFTRLEAAFSDEGVSLQVIQVQGAIHTKFPKSEVTENRHFLQKCKYYIWKCQSSIQSTECPPIGSVHLLPEFERLCANLPLFRHSQHWPQQTHVCGYTHTHTASDRWSYIASIEQIYLSEHQCPLKL